MARILVVDQCERFCETISNRLQKDGHETKVAYLGEVAIDFGYLFQPDVLITSWTLPGDYNGLEVSDAVLAANENVKTILLTTWNLQPDDKFSGIFSIVIEPFALDELAILVQKSV